MWPTDMSSSIPCAVDIDNQLPTQIDTGGTDWGGIGRLVERVRLETEEIYDQGRDDNQYPPQVIITDGPPAARSDDGGSRTYPENS